MARRRTRRGSGKRPVNRNAAGLKGISAEVGNALTRDIPEREAWLFKNEVALAMVLEGLAQAAAGRFAKNPPNV